MIRSIFYTLMLLLASVNTLLAEEVVWSTPKVQSLGEGEYEVSFSAIIEEGWNIYDLEELEYGPNPTTLTLTPQEGIELVGAAVTTPPATKKWDDVFAMEIGYFRDSVTLHQRVKVDRSCDLEFVVEWMACSGMMCTPPKDKIFSVTIDVPKAQSESSLWLIVLEAMLWGFAALLTPCVFPMVPMTISLFLKSGKGESSHWGRVAAMAYGGFIVLLYTLPIVAVIAVTYLFGGGTLTADIFNWVATHWLPNLLFFAIFILFAASLFGMFEFSLPSSWVNRADSKGDMGSIAGIFFLALTLVLVSFSCTGPIVGAVLIKSTSGEFWQPIVTMLAFSVAFALPFVVVALFPTLMSRLPRSGGWLASVKIVLGFVELALALKFFSVADQTYHWGLLSRELYLAIWIVIFSLLGLYLLGKLRFAHEPKVESIGFVRLLFSIVVFSFVVYIIPGLWGAPLKELAGYLPPPTESVAISKGGGSVEERGSSLPNGLSGFDNIEEAQSYANSVGKPLFVDLTGYGCVNCREMEQRVWSDPEVDNLLRNEYVIVALYLDDKREAPESEWITNGSGRVLKSVGRINSHYALERFGVNAQPYYILLGRDGKELVPPMGYNLNIDEYVAFLNSGIAAYRDRK